MEKTKEGKNKTKKQIIKQEKRFKNKSLKLSIKESIYVGVQTGFGIKYITPFALALKANNLEIGLISSFVGLISPLSQLYGSRLMEKKTRKQIITKFVLLQALMWIPIISLIFFFWRDAGKEFLPVALILFYVLLSIFGAISVPAWFSLMGDLVPSQKRGRFFSLRNKIYGTSFLIISVISAFILDYFKTKGIVLTGFLILFSVAMIARLICVKLLSQHYEPKLKLKKGYYFSFMDFIKKGLKTNFGKFVIYVAIMHISIMIASPFFIVYMLKDLEFSYMQYIIVHMSSTVFNLLLIKKLGKFSDKYGNRALLRIGAVLIPLIPLLWILNQNMYYLIFVPGFIGGAGWAAFTLSSYNFIYDSVKPEHRGLCITYYNIFYGTGMFLGAIIGGFLAQYLTISFMNKFLFIFLISGGLRALSSIIFIPQIKEIREIKKQPRISLEMFNPTTEIINEIVWFKKKAIKSEKEFRQGISLVESGVFKINSIENKDIGNMFRK